jgi:chromosome segregation ATPase
MASNEREIHYENQIKEYQIKRDQTVREIQDLRNELTRLQEEKFSNEKQLNELENQSLFLFVIYILNNRFCIS